MGVKPYCAKYRQGRRWALLLLFLSLLLLTPQAARAANHLWPAAALHFDAPAPETATFTMTQEQFQAELTAAQLELTANYDALYAALPAADQALLLTAQTAWQSCYDKFALVLAQLLDSPVKVFYGQEEERKTNIYRDSLLAMTRERAGDLDCWRQGRYAFLDPAGLAAAQEQLIAARKKLENSFGDNIYVMDERYRVPTQEAQQAWRLFVRDNAAFLAARTQANACVLNAEEGLQVERMYALSRLQREGYVFYHREREE